MPEILAPDNTLELPLARMVYSVSQLNQEVRFLLEENFPALWVEGEISNLRAPGSGHLYFTLKDANAQIRCALFRSRANQLKFQPKDGMQVTVSASISLYEERGDFQLIVASIEETGDGRLRRAYEALKQRLAAEGLFASEKKKPLPKLPHCIGVVTSPTGAAIRDILSVLQRRFPAAAVIIYPTQVQGSDASRQIVAALELANAQPQCDVLILARGGGSLEDLWPFNEEMVARAIDASEIPIISAIGHEIDFTIADFVADQRAPTPSAAAELVTPDATEWLTAIERLAARLTMTMRNLLNQYRLLLQTLQKRLPHPQRRLQDHAQRLDNLEQRLLLAQRHLLRHKQMTLAHCQSQLLQHTPSQQIQTSRLLCHSLQQRLQTAHQYLREQKQQQLSALMRALDGVSPLNTLNRGYAIVMRDKHIIYDAKDVNAGDKVQARVARGVLRCVVLAE